MDDKTVVWGTTLELDVLPGNIHGTGVTIALDPNAEFKDFVDVAQGELLVAP